MFLKENILLAVAGLKSNKMRALLTMLGIIIGIGSVIAIVSVGNSLTGAVTSNMASMGANSVIITIQEKGDTFDMMNMSMSAPEDKEMLTNEQIDTLVARFGEKLETVSLTETLGSGKAKEGRLYANVTVMGSSPGYMKANNLDLLKGRFISEKDDKGVRKVAVVSDKFVNNIFGQNVEPIGREVKITINDMVQTYTIIGIYKYEDSPYSFSTASEKDKRTNFFIPVNTAKIDAQYKNYAAFTVMAKEGVDTIQLSRDINKYLERLYQNNPDWTYTSISMESAISVMTNMLGTISIAVAVIAAISLLVGGIGVMNIMLVSVTERTREIGTRKALGAKNSYIRVQFIVESVIICVIGGIIGVIFGIGLGTFGSSLLGYPASISIPVIIIAVTFAMIIGVFFGYYPASKAAKLDPIEALRYE